MAYVSPGTIPASSAPFGALLAGWAGFREAVATYRRKREVYLRTLRELNSYQPHELHDLRLQPADFEEVARMQAGLR